MKQIINRIAIATAAAHPIAIPTIAPVGSGVVVGVGLKVVVPEEQQINLGYLASYNI